MSAEVETSSNPIPTIGEKKKVGRPPGPPKEKKPRVLSDKQKENLKKGFAALQAKRAESKKNLEEEATKMATTEEEKEQALTQLKYVKAKKQRKALPPELPFITRAEFDRFRTELTTAKPTVVEAPKPMPVPVPVAAPVASTRVITGKEVLDRIFFST